MWDTQIGRNRRGRPAAALLSSVASELRRDLICAARITKIVHEVILRLPLTTLGGSVVSALPLLCPDSHLRLLSSAHNHPLQT
jgi:hypothetical protein